MKTFLVNSLLLSLATAQIAIYPNNTSINIPVRVITESSQTSNMIGHSNVKNENTGLVLVRK